MAGWCRSGPMLSIRVSLPTFASHVEKRTALTHGPYPRPTSLFSFLLLLLHSSLFFLPLVLLFYLFISSSLQALRHHRNTRHIAQGKEGVQSCTRRTPCLLSNSLSTALGLCPASQNCSQVPLELDKTFRLQGNNRSYLTSYSSKANHSNSPLRLSFRFSP